MILVYKFPCTLACIRTRPAEGTDTQSLDRHNPYATDDVLALVYILLVGTLSVEHTYLIVYKIASSLVLEEVALNLHTNVTSIACMFANTVAEAR